MGLWFCVKGMRDMSICSRQTEESDSDIEFGYSLSTVCSELSSGDVCFGLCLNFQP